MALINTYRDRSAAVTAGVAQFLARHELPPEALNDPKVRNDALATLNRMSLSAEFNVEDITKAQALLAESVAGKTAQLREASSTKGATAGFGGSSSVHSPKLARLGVKNLDGDQLPLVQKLLSGDLGALENLAKTLDILAWTARPYELSRALGDREFVMTMLEVAKNPGPRAKDKLTAAVQKALKDDASAPEQALELSLLREKTAMRPRSEPKLTGLLHLIELLPDISRSLSLTVKDTIALAGPALAAAAAAGAGKAVLSDSEQQDVRRSVIRQIPIEKLPRFQTGQEVTADLIKRNEDLHRHMKEACQEYLYLMGSVVAVCNAIKGAGPTVATELGRAALATLSADGSNEKAFERVQKAVIAEGGQPSTRPSVPRDMIPWALTQILKGSSEAGDAAGALKEHARTAKGAPASSLIEETVKAAKDADPGVRKVLVGVLEQVAKQDGGRSWWSGEARTAMDQLGAS